MPKRIQTPSAPTESVSVARMAYSVDEAATSTGLSRSTLYIAMKAGQLAFLKCGSRRLITVVELEAFLVRLGGAV